MISISLLLFVFYILFIFLSFFFSGSEAGYLSLNKHRFELDKDKNKGATRIIRYVYNMDYLLLLLLFGNNLSNILATGVAHSIGDRIFGIHKDNTISFLINTVTIILLFSFGEVLPKWIFRIYSNALLYKTSSLLRFFDMLFSPILLILKIITKVLSFIIGNKVQKVLFLSRDDFSNIIDDSIETGLLNQDETYLLETFSSISETNVKEVMTPVSDLILIEKNEDVNNYRKYFKEINAVYMCVYEKRIDNIIGYINLYDIFKSTKKKKIAKNFLITTQYIPFLNTLDDVYNRFSNTNKLAFIVVDEYGGCCGVISQKKVIERLFGLSYKNKNAIETKYIKQINLYTYEMDSIVDIDDFNRIFEINIPKKDYETLAGFLYSLFGYIPKEGYKADFQEIYFTVLKATEKSVDRILVEFSKERYKFEEKKIQFFESEEEKKD